ncbi:MAG: hypothetical protein QM747_01055 [Nocardioides sp.]
MTDLREGRSDDRMDERLAAAGRQWQRRQAPPPAVPLERLDATVRRLPSWRMAAVAAAAVVLVGGGSLAVLRATGGSDAGPSHRPSTPPVTHGIPVDKAVVPWRDLPARHPHLGHRVHGQRVTKYDGIVATGHLGGTVHPGDTLTFVVTLESDRGVVLKPCPDFGIAFGRHSFDTWQLNCKAVLFRVGSATGSTKDLEPWLPAHRPMRFAMQVRVPDVHGDQKVLWTLEGPQSAPGFYGIVRVTPR